MKSGTGDLEVMQEQGVHEHASWNSCMHFRIQCLSSFKNDFHQISYPQCRGEGGLRAQFFRSQSGSKIFIHKALCHDARIWPISCLACFYAWADLVIPMALCTLFRLFNFNFFSKIFFGAFVWGPTLSPKHLS